MNKIQSFANAKEYQELFGYVEHGNGVKSRRNKILLALLKSKSVWADDCKCRGLSGPRLYCSP